MHYFALVAANHALQPRLRMRLIEEQLINNEAIKVSAYPKFTVEVTVD